MEATDILVVDDQDQVREYAMEVLRLQGHRVSGASDGVAALRSLRSHPCGVIVTDVLMPEMDGIQLIREIGTHFPDVRIVAMSGGGQCLSDAGYTQMAKGLGAHATLSKPFKPAQLLQAVESACSVSAD